MTCIVALKTKKYLYIGGDRFVSGNDNGRNMLNSKVFKKQNMLFGVSGSLRFTQIVEKYLDIPVDNRESPIDYIIMDIISNIRTISEEYKYSSKDHNGQMSYMLICYKSNIFEIQSDWSVIEYDDYCSIGSGFKHAEGSLYTLSNICTNITPEEKIKLAIMASSHHTPSVCDKHIDILKVEI